MVSPPAPRATGMTSEYQNDKENASEVIEHDELNFQCMSVEIQIDRDSILEHIKLNGNFLKYLDFNSKMMKLLLRWCSVVGKIFTVCIWF